LFAIDSETGNLSLIELPLLAGIEHHRLLILAADGGHPSLSASLQLVVRFVPSIGEKQQLLSIWPPIYSAHLAENAEPGTEIVRVRLENEGESGTSWLFPTLNAEHICLTKQPPTTFDSDWWTSVARPAF